MIKGVCVKRNKENERKSSSLEKRNETAIQKESP